MKLAHAESMKRIADERQHDPRHTFTHADGADGFRIDDRNLLLGETAGNGDRGHPTRRPSAHNHYVRHGKSPG